MRKEFYNIFQNLDFESYKLIKKGIEISGGDTFFQLKHLFLAFDIVKPEVLKKIFNEESRKNLIFFVTNIETESDYDNDELFMVLESCMEKAKKLSSLINIYMIIASIFCTKNRISYFLRSNYFELENFEKNINKMINDASKLKGNYLSTDYYDIFSNIFENINKKN